MKRMRLKKKSNISRKNVLVLSIVLIFFTTIYMLFYISKRVSPILMNFAEVETVKIANLIINKAVTKQVVNNIKLDELFSMVQNKDGEIQTIDFNPVIVNKVLNMASNIVQINLKAIEQGNIESVELPEEILVEFDKKNLKRGIIYEIPIGAISGNAFLANLGPKVPVKLNLIGNVLSNINTKVEPYGINNALIQVYVHIEVAEQVNLPFMSKRVKVSSDIPVAMKIVTGKIPVYYSGISQNSPILTLPVK